MTGPLRRRTFAWFFAGRLTSQLGSSMAPVALTLAVLEGANRSSDLGVILAAALIPHLLLLLVGGASADRFSRRAALVTATLGSAITQGLVATILLSGSYSLPWIAGLEFANGVLAAFTTPALRGIVPELVDAGDLQKANALLASARNATTIIGPSVAGILVAGASGGTAIAFDAATYALAALCLLRLTAAPAPNTARTPLLRNIREGLSYFGSVRWLWPVSTAFFVVNLVQTGPWQILGPQITEQQGGPRTWGLVLSARAVGLLIMSLLMYRLVVRRHLRVVLLASIAGATPLLALGAGVHGTGLIIAAVVGGAGSSASAITWDSALQSHIRRDKLSRVASIDDLLSYTAIPVGQLTASPLAAHVGAPTVCLTAALIWIAAVLTPLNNRTVRNLAPPRPRSATAERESAPDPPDRV